MGKGQDLIIRSNFIIVIGTAVGWKDQSKLEYTEYTR